MADSCYTDNSAACTNEISIVEIIAGKIDDSKLKQQVLQLTPEEQIIIDGCAKLQFKQTENALRTDWYEVYCCCTHCVPPLRYSVLDEKLRDALYNNIQLESVLFPHELEVINSCLVLSYIKTHGSFTSVSEKWFKDCSPTCICNTTRKSKAERRKLLFMTT